MAAGRNERSPSPVPGDGRLPISVSVFKPLVVVDVPDGQWYAIVSDGTTKIRVTQWPLQNQHFNADASTILHIELFLADNDLVFLKSQGKKFAELLVPALKVREAGLLFRSWFGLQRGRAIENAQTQSADVAADLYQVCTSLATNLLTPKICVTVSDTVFAERVSQPPDPYQDRWESALKRSVMQHGNIIAHMHRQLRTLWAQGKVRCQEGAQGDLVASLAGAMDMDPLQQSVNSVNSQTLEHVEKLQGEVLRLTEALTSVAAELEESEQLAEMHYRSKMHYRDLLSGYTNDLPSDEDIALSRPSSIEDDSKWRYKEDLEVERKQNAALRERVKQLEGMSPRASGLGSGPARTADEAGEVRTLRGDKRRLEEEKQMQQAQITGLRHSEREMKARIEWLQRENDKATKERIHKEAEVAALREELKEKTSRLVDAWASTPNQSARDRGTGNNVPSPADLQRMEQEAVLQRLEVERLRSDLASAEERGEAFRKQWEDASFRADTIEEEMGLEVQRQKERCQGLQRQLDDLHIETEQLQDVEREKRNAQSSEVETALQLQVQALTDRERVMQEELEELRKIKDTCREAQSREQAFALDLERCTTELEQTKETLIELRESQEAQAQELGEELEQVQRKYNEAQAEVKSIRLDKESAIRQSNDSIEGLMNELSAVKAQFQETQDEVRQKLASAGEELQLERDRSAEHVLRIEELEALGEVRKRESVEQEAALRENRSDLANTIKKLELELENLRQDSAEQERLALQTRRRLEADTEALSATNESMSREMAALRAEMDAGHAALDSATKALEEEEKARVGREELVGELRKEVTRLNKEFETAKQQHREAQEQSMKLSSAASVHTTELEQAFNLQKNMEKKYASQLEIQKQEKQEILKAHQEALKALEIAGKQIEEQSAELDKFKLEVNKQAAVLSKANEELNASEVTKCQLQHELEAQQYELESQIANFTSQVKIFETKNQEILAELEQRDAELDNVKEAYDCSVQDNQSMQAEWDAAEQQLSDVKQQLGDAKQLVTTLEHDLAALQLSEESLRRELSSAQQEQRSLRQELTSLTISKEITANDNLETKAEVEALQAKIKDFQEAEQAAQHKIAAAETELSALRQSHAEGKSEEAALRQRLGIMEADILDLRTVAQNAQKMCADTEAELAASSDNAQKLDGQNASFLQELKESKEIEVELRTQIVEFERKESERIEAFASLQEKNSEQRRDLESLQKQFDEQAGAAELQNMEFQELKRKFESKKVDYEEQIHCLLENEQRLAVDASAKALEAGNLDNECKALLMEKQQVDADLGKLQEELDESRSKVTKLRQQCEDNDKFRQEVSEQYQNELAELRGQSAVVKQLQDQVDEANAKMMEKEEILIALKESHNLSLEDKDEEIRELQSSLDRAHGEKSDGAAETSTMQQQQVAELLALHEQDTQAIEKLCIEKERSSKDVQALQQMCQDLEDNAAALKAQSEENLRREHEVALEEMQSRHNQVVQEKAEQIIGLQKKLQDSLEGGANSERREAQSAQILEALESKAAELRKQHEQVLKEKAAEAAALREKHEQALAQTAAEMKALREQQQQMMAKDDDTNSIDIVALRENHAKELRDLRDTHRRSLEKTAVLLQQKAEEAVEFQELHQKVLREKNKEISALREDFRSLQQKQAALQEAGTPREAQAAKNAEELQVLLGMKEALKDELAELRKKHEAEVGDYQSQFAKQDAEFCRTVDELRDVREEVSAMRSKHSELQRVHQALEVRCQAQGAMMEQRGEAFDAEIGDALGRLRDEEAKLNDLRLENQALEFRLQSLTQTPKSDSNSKADLQRQLATANAEIATLKKRCAEPSSFDDRNQASLIADKHSTLEGNHRQLLEQIVEMEERHEVTCRSLRAQAAASLEAQRQAEQDLQNELDAKTAALQALQNEKQHQSDVMVGMEQAMKSELRKLHVRLENVGGQGQVGQTGGNATNTRLNASPDSTDLEAEVLRLRQLTDQKRDDVSSLTQEQREAESALRQAYNQLEADFNNTKMESRRTEGSLIERNARLRSEVRDLEDANDALLQQTERQFQEMENLQNRIGAEIFELKKDRKADPVPGMGMPPENQSDSASSLRTELLTERKQVATLMKDKQYLQDRLEAMDDASRAPASRVLEAELRNKLMQENQTLRERLSQYETRGRS